MTDPTGPGHTGSTGPGQAGRPPVNLGPGAPPPPPQPYYRPPVAYPVRPRRSGAVAWIITALVLAMLFVSLLVNVVLLVGSVKTGHREVTYRQGTSPGRFVIVPINSVIDESTYEFVRSSLEYLRARPPEAVILRVESGGGMVGPSDRIYSELKRFKQMNIPVVASYGTLAASGAYYLSAGSDWIVAEPTCITGSIGVISTAFTVDRMLDKWGVTPEVAAASDSPNKDVANNMFRPWDERDRARQQGAMDHFHARFVDVVFEGRKSHLQTRQQALALANGDIYTAQEALDAKLIDEQGYLDAAIDKAKQLAKMAASAEPRITIMRKPLNLGMLGVFGAGRSAPTTFDGQEIRRVVGQLQTPQFEYRYP